MTWNSICEWNPTGTSTKKRSHYQFLHEVACSFFKVFAHSFHTALISFIKIINVDPVILEVYGLKGCISQLCTIESKSLFLCPCFLDADNFNSSLVDDTTSSSVLAQAALLARFIDSTASDADRWYMKMLPPKLHFAPGYTSLLSRVFKYFSAFLSTYCECLCLICSISCFVWALTSLLNNQRQEYFTFPPLTILAMFYLLWNEQWEWTASGSTWYIASFKPLAWLVMMVVSNLLSDGCRLLQIPKTEPIHPCLCSQRGLQTPMEMCCN